jgi:hypothetical protein
MAKDEVDLSSKEIGDRGEFLVRKSIFLLASSVGKVTAETLISQAINDIGRTRTGLTLSDIPSLAVSLKPGLSNFVGDEKAERLTAALRVLVGGVLA